MPKKLADLSAQELYQLAAQKDQEEQEAQREANAAEVKRLQQDRKPCSNGTAAIREALKDQGIPTDNIAQTLAGLKKQGRIESAGRAMYRAV